MSRHGSLSGNESEATASPERRLKSPTSGSLHGKGGAAQKVLNCAECRRLKLKCDREIPCGNCIKRSCAELCPNGIKTTRRAGGLTSHAAEQLQNRLSSLETLLEQHGIDFDTGVKLKADAGPSHSISRNDPRPTDPQQRAFPFPEPPALRGDKRRRSDHEYIAPNSATLPPSLRRQSDMDYPHSGARFDHQSGPQNIANLGSSFLSPILSGPPKTNDVQVQSPIEHGHGTLVLTQSGSSRYLGPTAGTEWLKNQELNDLESSPSSPARPASLTLPDMPEGQSATNRFPFFLPGKERSFEDLLAQLPSPDDTAVLIDCYYRYFTWNHDVAPRRSCRSLLGRVLDPRPTVQTLAKNTHPQQLALVYMMLAIGSLYNLELPQHDPQAEDFLFLAKACLTKGDFLNHNTIPGVQTLLMMGHYHLETEKGRNGNQAWPLWGLAMRIIVAMGLHRDGGRWNLPFEVVDERRQVFWEAHTIEVFQANCFSRPSCLVPRYIDTIFPAPYPPPDEAFPKAYKTLKYEICQMSAKILDMGMGVDPAPYGDVHEMFMKLCDFERRIPFNFRCRSALCALPSVYPDPSVAISESPEPNRRQITQSFQQFTLSLNVSENILYLQRPYFVMAMHDQPLDPTRSIYGHSYLAVVERCNVIIQVVNGLYDLHPTISVRHWFFWYHLFTAAVCVGTLILRHPQSVLAQFALSQIDQAIVLFAAVTKHNPSPSMQQNHEWLTRLRARATDKISHEASKFPSRDSLNSSASVDGEEDVELLGWRTRLIEQAGAGGHRARNIVPKGRQNPPSAPPSANPGPATGTFGEMSSDNSPLPLAVAEVLQQHLGYSFDPTRIPDTGGVPVQPSTQGQPNADSSTDLLLHQYWDPMIFSDARTDQGPLPSTNWWSWDHMGLTGEPPDLFEQPPPQS